MALMLPVPVMGALVLALWKDSSLCGGARMNLVLEVSPHEPRMGHLPHSDQGGCRKGQGVLMGRRC